ncbi:SIMPL domain-containing protein [Mesonia ostreae]|uniref:SIMPL domain-containing protein n=1 Tax=Mesonia ostreae TaxID=861110 RepID=A0ABU2KK74_9FLAO|nr:SIMPL domain-containing protein [Mesonia ostreae]MDT0295142.1 SIMPL domain-containing protein [Mesonia ostreae]
MKKLIFSILMLVAISSFAQSEPFGVQVMGEGSIMATPDEVNLSIRVEHEGNTAQEVKNAVDKDVKSVFQFLSKTGVKDKYVRTEYLNVNKNYQYQTKTYNYVANQAISIKLKDLAKYEEVISGLLATGINRIDGIQFGSSNMDELKSQARKKAIQNAKAKAEEYIEELGHQLGTVKYIAEVSSSQPYPVAYKNAAMLQSESSGDENSPSISLGEMEVTAKIHVRFSIIEKN